MGGCCSSSTSTGRTSVHAVKAGPNSPSHGDSPEKTTKSGFTDIADSKKGSGSQQNGNDVLTIDTEAATRMSSLTVKELEDKLRRERSLTESPHNATQSQAQSQ